MGCCISTRGKALDEKTLGQPSSRYSTPRRYGVLPNSEYPPPCPPTERKRDRYPGQPYRQMDRFASKVSEKVLELSQQDVADFITRQAKTEVDCARAVFRYVTSINLARIQIDPACPLSAKSGAESLFKLKTHQSNHAHLFRDLARLCGLACVVINGISKNSSYDVGVTVEEPSMACQWNAVYVDEQWRLVDAYWGSLCVVGHRSSYWHIVNVDGEGVRTEEEAGVGLPHRRRNDFFFLTDPDMFICTHFPNDPKWQLLPHQLTKSQFKDFVYVREQFFELELYMLEESHQNGILHAVDGEVTISFGTPTRADNYKNGQEFSYLLFMHREGLKKSRVKLENNVMFEQKHDSIHYTAWFPVAGEFRFDLFGRKIAGENEEEYKLDLVCSYAIRCTQPKTDFTELPDCPEIGWGPGSCFHAVGLDPISHTGGVINTTDGVVQIRFKQTSQLRIGVSLKSLNLEDWDLEKYVLVRSENGELIIEARLPKKGSFALKLFAAAPGHVGELPNVCNYLIQHSSDGASNRPFPLVPGQILGTSQRPNQQVTPVSHNGDLLDTQDEKISLQFKSELPKNLFTQLHHISIPSDEFVDTKAGNEGAICDITLDQAGEYAFNVFTGNTKNDRRLHHAHSYLIKHKINAVQPGGDEMLKTSAIYSRKNTMDLKLPKGDSPRMFAIECKRSSEIIPDSCVTTSADNAHDFYHVRLPHQGLYNFSVYDATDAGHLKQIAKYHIDYGKIRRPGAHDVEQDDDAETARKKQNILRVRLKMATVSGSYFLLKKALMKCDKEQLPERDGDLARAKQQMLILQIEKNLKAAMQSRERRKLEKAIESVEKNNLVGRMFFQLVMARRMLLDVLKDKIRKMDQTTIAEMKSYQAPPPPVLHVMQAAFMLLGHEQSSLKHAKPEWETLKTLVGDTNKMKARLKEQTPSNISADTARRAREVLAGLDDLQVSKVSEVAETFYAWSTNILKLKDEEIPVTKNAADD